MIRAVRHRRIVERYYFELAPLLYQWKPDGWKWRGKPELKQ